MSGLDYDVFFLALTQASVYLKAKISNGQMEGIEVVGVTVSQFVQMSTNLQDIKSVCIDFTSTIAQKMGGVVESMTIEDILVSSGNVTKEQLDAIPRITKEQFYDLSN